MNAFKREQDKDHAAEKEINKLCSGLLSVLQTYISAIRKASKHAKQL